MPRATNTPASRRRRKKILKAAKGYIGGRRKLITAARQTVSRGRLSAYRDRRRRKREFRALWITRINAACRLNGLSYSAFLHALKEKGLEMDRRVLADLAARDPQAFAQIVSSVRS
ncbi:MAG: 50S ribosomal protein L20 [Candidatus Zixiibacteriota bacterium]|nr:MAG: 50S ribosomal protein L20 [candidate division Zixibacteria bacterium]